MTNETDKTVDPFDPAQFAASSVLQGNMGVEKMMVTCPVRKPGKQEFIRVNPDAAYSLKAHIIEFKDERETYLLLPAVAAELPGEYRNVMLKLAVSRQGALFLWPLPLPSDDGRDTDWGVSARAAAVKAEHDWVRLIGNMSQQAYDVFTASGSLGTPSWPNKSLGDILAIAFGEKFVIRDMDHPVIRRLTGRM